MNQFRQETKSSLHSPVQPRETSLSRHAAYGFAWMVGQTVITKATGLIGQIIVAWFLSPEDFGIVSLAYAAASFTTILRDAGLQSILVQRQHHLRRWISSVFWMSAVMGIISTLLTIAISPLLAVRYHEPRLVFLISILGIGSFISGLSTVPSAILQIQLRFAFQAKLGLAIALITVLMNIGLAWKGCGAYSFVLPLVMANALRLIILWTTVKYKPELRFHLKRWPLLLNDSGSLLLNQLLCLAVSNGDYLILGARYRDDKQVIGLFFFAFNLSMQTLTLLTVNLGGVLFASLAKIGSDPIRQAQAFVRSMRLLALVAIPFCLLQGALARPVINLLFSSKWYPAIPILQALSVAMAIHVVGIMFLNLTSAQGRFRLQVIICAIACLIFLTSVAVAALYGKGLTVAIVETIFFGITDPVWLYFVFKRDFDNPLRQVVSIYALPLALSVTSIYIAYILPIHAPNSRYGCVLEIAVVSFVSISIYTPLVKIFAPRQWHEFAGILKRSKMSAA